MSKSPSFELAPEFVEVQAELDAINEKRAALNARATEIFAARERVKAAWWTENISKFDLFDRDDFRELGIANWNNGIGDVDTISPFIDATLKSEGVARFLGRYGHVGHDTDKDYSFSLNTFIVRLDEEISDEEIVKLADVITRIQRAARAWKPGYEFYVSSLPLEDDFDEDDDYGQTFLHVGKNGAYVYSKNSYSYRTVISTAPLVDVLKEIAKRSRG
jgi:hypothetical protein